MAATLVDAAPAEAPGLPDYLINPDAVLAKTKTQEAASLPNLVENLVKNWEIEVSFKTEIDDWRTIDRPNYTFSINGGPPQSAEHMLKVGTYNAIVTANDYYSPEHSDFEASHKNFMSMMPTFAWQVLEVYSGPPVVAFKWRHWGVMKNDYIGFNDKGENVSAKAHGGTIDIQGITVATVDDKVRLRSVETWFDPMEMFRKIAPNGITSRSAKIPGGSQLHDDDSGDGAFAHDEMTRSASAGCPVLLSNQRVLSRLFCQYLNLVLCRSICQAH